MSHELSLIRALTKTSASITRQADEAMRAASRGQSLWEALKSTGPGGRAALGAAAGGYLGHNSAKDDWKVDEQGNVKKKSTIPSTLAGAAAGAAAGGLSHPEGRKWAWNQGKRVVQWANARKLGLHNLKKESSADLVKVADQWGRELAHEDFEKSAIAFNLGGVMPAIAKGINAVGPKIRPAVAAIGRARPGQLAAGGAALGAGINMARNAMKPKDQRGSYLGAAAKGAVVGGVAGAASREIARKAVTTPAYRAASKGNFSFPGQKLGYPASQAIVHVNPAAGAGPRVIGQQ